VLEHLPSQVLPKKKKKKSENSFLYKDKHVKAEKEEEEGEKGISNRYNTLIFESFNSEMSSECSCEQIWYCISKFLFIWGSLV
jgi:hypothetical protein